MKADTYARLVVLDTLVEAEIGFLLAHHPPLTEELREGMAGRVAGMIEEIETLDRSVASRAWEAIVGLVARLPEDDDGIEAAALRCRRALSRIMQRGFSRHDLADAAVWTAVLEVLLRTLALEYRAAMRASAGAELAPRERERIDRLLDTARNAADRMLWNAADGEATLSEAMDRLTHAVRYRRIPPAEVDTLASSIVRLAAKHRPSTISRVGAFVLRQLLGGGSESGKKTSRKPAKKRADRNRSSERKPGRAA
jgi:hypothetical protein